MRKNNIGKLHQTAAIMTAMAMAISSPMTILADTVDNDTKTESSESSSDSKSESSSDSKSESSSDSKSESSSDSKSESSSDSKSESSSDSKSESSSDSKSESSSDSKGESSSDSKSESSSDSKSESSSDSKSESSGDSKSESSGESKGEANGESKGETGGESKGETGGESKGEAKGETKGESQGEAKGETSGEAKGETKGETSGEAKGETKGEANGESKGEANGETKGETKGETSGEVKGEAKGETSGETKGESQGETKGETKGETGSENQGENQENGGENNDAANNDAAENNNAAENGPSQVAANEPQEYVESIHEPEGDERFPKVDYPTADGENVKEIAPEAQALETVVYRGETFDIYGEDVLDEWGWPEYTKYHVVYHISEDTSEEELLLNLSDAKREIAENLHRYEAFAPNNFQPGDRVEFDFTIKTDSNHTYKYEEASFILAAPEGYEETVNSRDFAIRYNDVFAGLCQEAGVKNVDTYRYNINMSTKDLKKVDEVLNQKVADAEGKTFTEKYSTYLLNYYNEKYNETNASLEDVFRTHPDALTEQAATEGYVTLIDPETGKRQYPGGVSKVVVVSGSAADKQALFGESINSANKIILPMGDDFFYNNFYDNLFSAAYGTNGELDELMKNQDSWNAAGNNLTVGDYLDSMLDAKYNPNAEGAWNNANKFFMDLTSEGIAADKASELAFEMAINVDGILTGNEYQNTKWDYYNSITLERVDGELQLVKVDEQGEVIGDGPAADGQPEEQTAFTLWYYGKPDTQENAKYIVYDNENNVYAVKDYNAEESKESYYIYTTGGEINIDLVMLEDIIYYLQEAAAPAGYVRDTEVHVICTEEQYNALNLAETEMVTPMGETATAKWAECFIDSETPVTIKFENKKEVIPEEPKDEEEPENPEEPKDPEEPKTPEEPETPEAPETPEEPKTPEAPETPEAPKTPEAHENPETPAEHEAAETPIYNGSNTDREKAVAGVKREVVYLQPQQPEVLGAAREENAEGEVLGASRMNTVTPEKGVLGAQRLQQVLGAERNPQTGDDSHSILWALFCLAGVAGLYIWTRFHEKKEGK